MLAAALVAGGAAFGVYLLGTIKPLPSRSSTSAPPAAPIVSCQLGSLLIYPNCYPLSPGNVDLNLNAGNKFSTPGSEYADLYVVTGAIRVTDRYSPSVQVFYAGAKTGLAPFHIVTAIQDGTKLQKRVR
jgi:hypothetical protein